ncbi:MAG: hypothetical protein NVSMB6_01510 [Burkholderiaceae bacterium]
MGAFSNQTDASSKGYGESARHRAIHTRVHDDITDLPTYRASGTAFEMLALVLFLSHHGLQVTRLRA